MLWCHNDRLQIADLTPERVCASISVMLLTFIIIVTFISDQLFLLRHLSSITLFCLSILPLSVLFSPESGVYNKCCHFFVFLALLAVGLCKLYHLHLIIGTRIETSFQIGGSFYLPHSILAKFLGIIAIGSLVLSILLLTRCVSEKSRQRKLMDHLSLCVIVIGMVSFLLDAGFGLKTTDPAGSRPNSEIVEFYGESGISLGAYIVCLALLFKRSSSPL